MSPLAPLALLGRATMEAVKAEDEAAAHKKKG
jgi:hypothetical protein